MKHLVVDVETTTKNRGHPFTPENKMCVVGTRGYNNSTFVYNIEYDEQPYGHYLNELQKQINDSDILVLFNAKFDLHWLRRYNIEFQHKRIWDCQLAEFVYTYQKIRMPSLNQVCEQRGLGQKLDVIKEEYWDKDIDTPDIPYDILSKYLIQDLLLTEKLYLAQINDERYPAKRALLGLENADLLVLQEMEWNGLPFDVEASLKKSQEIEKQIEEITHKLNGIVGSNVVNWNSTDHVSAVLYGGVVEEPIKIPAGVFKTGKKAGQDKFSNGIKEHVFPRLVEPLPKTELKKPGLWSTDEPTLRSLKITGKAKDIVELLQEVTKLDKMNGTYYKGIPKLIAEMGWEGNIIHGQLNKCVAVTGRLSSSKPNLQNMAEDVFNLIKSRF